jgi:hypothetical protein
MIMVMIIKTKIKIKLKIKIKIKMILWDECLLHTALLWGRKEGESKVWLPLEGKKKSAEVLALHSITFFP